MDAQVGSTVNTDSVKPTANIGQFWNCLYKVWPDHAHLRAAAPGAAVRTTTLAAVGRPGGYWPREI